MEGVQGVRRGEGGRALLGPNSLVLVKIGNRELSNSTTNPGYEEPELVVGAVWAGLGVKMAC